MFFYTYSAAGGNDGNFSGGVEIININDIEPDDSVYELLSADTEGLELSYVESQIALRDAYGDSLGFDHGPSGIEVISGTPMFGGNLYMEIAKSFYDCGVKEYFGINIDEFLNKTREQRITLQKLAVQFSNSELAAVEVEKNKSK